MSKSFLELCAERYSCRSYKPEMPTEESLAAVLEAARLAPSATNRQPWRLVLIKADDLKGREAIVAAYPREWVATAPYFIVVCGVPCDAWVRPYDGKNHIYVDVAIITEHICLAAADQGLGSCWICNFDPARLTVDLELPQGVVPMVIVPLGYPAIAATEKKRKALEEILIQR